MEQHPVPQNVTSFQFKLIGDITLKQFAYLAGGVILGYLSLKISFIPSFLRYPVGGFFALFGVGLAFIPIEERPLDRWLAAFIKSIYAPTQFVWQKNNQPPEILASPTTTVGVVKPASPVAPKLISPVPVPAAQSFILKGMPVKPVASPVPQVTDVRPQTTISPPPAQSSLSRANPNQGYMKSNPPPAFTTPLPVKPVVDNWTIGAPPATTRSFDSTMATVPMPKPDKNIVFEKRSTPVISPPPVQKQVEQIKMSYQEKTQKLNEQILSLQKELAAGTIAKERLIELQQVLLQMASEKERLSRELVDLKQKMTTQQNASTVVRPTTYTTTPSDTHTTVKMVSPQTAVRVGIPRLTNIPNVITGIVKDSKNSLLPNLIVTVKDREGVPVRALKTNKLGQFAASTPLAPGVYIIEIEDPKKAFNFQRVEVTLTDQVLPPLEISAISERDVLRQKLTREIFGGNGM